MSRVLVVGAGLLGASLGQALSKAGHEVFLNDSSSSNLRLAVDYGAGKPIETMRVEPDLVVVCVPPDHAARAIVDALARYQDAAVTDVTSIKAAILDEVLQLDPTADVARYVGSHPMAGREKVGPASAQSDLFFSRPWIVTPHEKSDPMRVAQLRSIAADLGALPSQATPAAHDEAVALVSHLPQLVSSLLAGLLVDANPDHLAVSGQGLRDTVRIAASDPDLWIQIITRNSVAILPLLSALSDSLNKLRVALAALDEPGSLKALHQVLQAGNLGAARIPGKHGGKSVSYSVLTVVIDDSPGQLAKLLTEIGEIGVNLEDMKLSHSPGAPIGIVELSVLPENGDLLAAELAARDWRLA